MNLPLMLVVHPADISKSEAYLSPLVFLGDVSRNDIGTSILEQPDFLVARGVATNMRLSLYHFPFNIQIGSTYGLFLN
jgi:hypothetical protein